MYIVLEGCNGVGKTSVLEGIVKVIRKRNGILAEYMNKHGHIIANEPGDGKLATTIKAMTEMAEELLLGVEEDERLHVRRSLAIAISSGYTQIRARHIRDVIAPARESKQMILGSRCFVSEIVYRCLRFNTQPFVSMAKAIVPEIVPDCIVFLADSVENIAHRGNMTVESAQKLTCLYTKVFDMMSHEHYFCNEIGMIPVLYVRVEGSIEDAQNAVVNALESSPPPYSA